MKVDVCIATYRRPRGLRRLLGGLQAQQLPQAAVPQVRVVVVDNDPEASARELCEEARGWLRFPLVYVLEKRRGIPQARNTAVATSLGEADFLAFVDDDEVPDPGWLMELLRVQQARGADAVAGPCLPLFEDGAPAWIGRGRFFEPRRHTTGARIDYAFTHNVLVRMESLAQMEALFDERLALTGSSDVEFFDRFVEGRRIVWADEARVREWVPASRARLGWLLRREFRVGSSLAWIERWRRPRRRSDAWILANACWCLGKATALLVPAALRGRVAAVRALRLGAYALGRLYALSGRSYDEYRTTHGS
jgi:glycosyltransferase involved in cell wall biosynthesis